MIAASDQSYEGTQSHMCLYPFSLKSFPGSGKELACDAGETREVDLILGWGRSLGGGNGNLLQYSCLENPMDRGTCLTIVHGGHSVKHD